MLIIESILKYIKKHKTLYGFLVLPFYFTRFIYYSIKEQSLWFYRYYPGHYGSTIPSWKQIKNNSTRIFSHTLTVDGIDLNRENQEYLLKKIATFYRDFKPHRNPSSSRRYYYDNSLFGFNDGFILYSIFRLYQPSRVIEIGSGFSSALILDVVEELRLNTKATFIDPYSKNVTNLLEEKSSHHQVLREDVRNLDLDFFSSLVSGDILFIDSSHVLKIDSDLSYIFFSILPILQKGVIIHIHDVWYPFEYPKSMIRQGRIWNEPYIVRAFLQFNRSFEVLYFNDYMEKNYREYIADVMPECCRYTGKSLWLKKVS